jgi:hypothetical protein
MSGRAGAEAVKKRTPAERDRERDDLRREVFGAPPSTVSAARKILARTKRLYAEELAELRPVVELCRTFKWERPRENVRPNCDLS